MDIITEIEKCCISLVHQGKQKEADDLRHQAANILRRAPKPKSNLTSQQKLGLAYFNKNKELAVAPFDKGQGFVTLEREKLIKKSEDVSLDTPDTTTSYERKIQATLRTGQIR
jgi:hypothetical protein